MSLKDAGSREQNNGAEVESKKGNQMDVVHVLSIGFIDSSPLITSTSKTASQRRLNSFLSVKEREVENGRGVDTENLFIREAVIAAHFLKALNGH
jgi:hypothetical protein